MRSVPGIPQEELGCLEVKLHARTVGSALPEGVLVLPEGACVRGPGTLRLPPLGGIMVLGRGVRLQGLTITLAGPSRGGAGAGDSMSTVTWRTRGVVTVAPEASLVLDE